MPQAADAFRPDVPSTARMYDYYLGGKDNYPADRAAAERIIAMMPDGVVRSSALQNRGFLSRAVRHLTADLGIRQFLDIGTGLPTMNSVHQVAQSVAPDSRVVYVDHDPIVVAHSRNLLHGIDGTAIIRQDLRDPAAILADPELRAVLDLGQPVAVLLVAVLHFVAAAENPHDLVRSLMAPLPEGSFLVVSHFTADSFEQADAAALEYDNAASTLHSRHRSEVVRFFDGFQMTAPGSVVWTPQWRQAADQPEEDPEMAAQPGRSLLWCGVGRKLAPSQAEALPPVAMRRPPTLLQPLGAPVDPSYATFRPDIPNVARMYDYMLGGKDNYPPDRAAAERTFAVLGEDVVRGTVHHNRQFLGRAVRYLAADLGIRQFLDIGTGLPTMNSVHEVTRQAGANSQVVYVDNDPVVLAHARDMLNNVDGAVITNHDLRDPAAILADPAVRAVLDLRQPVAVLLIAILHFIADADDPAGLVRALMTAMPPGSCLAISHLTADHYSDADEAASVYAETSSGMHLRSRAAVGELFCDLPLLAPGEPVYAAEWHPVPDTPPVNSPGGAALWCGVAFKP